MAKLNTTVVIRDENSVTHVLGPDSEIPEWAEKVITNPNVWAEAPTKRKASKGKTAAKSAPKPEPEPDEDDSEADEIVSDDADGDAVELVGDRVEDGDDTPAEVEGASTGDDDTPVMDVAIPPKGGKGSGKAEWRAYALAATAAAGLNIDIPEDATRDDIVEALESADIPTE
ncbi:hypothetical protein [Microbacterium rhizophilus]|uniref:hypothetical protein n=1 Tax=Microbacterium rhizophilus TaxID=3138934 RepID=UPI0031EF095B